MSAAVTALITVGVLLLAAAAFLAGRAGRLARRCALAEDHLRRLEREKDSDQQERARLEAALEAADVGVLVTGVGGEVVYANPAALPYLRGRPGEAMVETQVGEAVTEALRRGEAQACELELYVPRRRVVRLEAVPLTAGTGEPIGVVAYVTDVTEERRVEAMRRDFVAAAGHELKTPVGAVSLLAETLAARVGDPTAASDLAGRLVAESGRLARLIDDMLDLSRVEGPLAASDPVAIAALVAEVVEQALPEATRRGVQLIMEEPSAAVSVPGDERQLRAMLANLVDNAVKYSDPQPGRPSPRVWVRFREEGEWVVIEVEDEGIGIPDGHHERIFERFYRVDRARSRATGGTGLGLAIVRHVALNHGGEVGVESRLGEGSRFRVRLPRWRET